jgi:hypothetical protein
VKLRLLVLFWLCSTTAAHVRPPRRVSLHYTRGETAQQCIDSIRLARKVEAYTGPVLVAPADAEAAVEVHIDARPSGGYRARIQLAWEGETPHGERVLEDDATDCRSFDDALAFVIATTVDPDLVLERVGVLFDPATTPQQEQLLAEPVPAPKQAAPPPASAGVEPAAPPAFVRTGALAIGAALSGGQPSLALGPAGAVRVRPWSWLELGFGMRMMFPSDSKPIDKGELRTRQFAFSLLACPRYQVAAHIALIGCVGPDIALLHAEARGLDDNEAGTLPSVGGVLRPELLLKLSELWSLDVAAFVRVSAPQRLSYTAEDMPRTAFDTPRVAPGAELSLRTDF